MSVVDAASLLKTTCASVPGKKAVLLPRDREDKVVVDDHHIWLRG